MSRSKTRLLVTIDLIPDAPKSITVREIMAALQDRGFDLGVPHGSHQRTVQRDLNHIKNAPLSKRLVSVEDASKLGNPLAWCWQRW